LIKNHFQKITTLALGQTARNVYLVTIGNGLNSALGFVAIALVSRTLGPEQFGLFSLAFGVYMSASKLTDLGLNFGMSRYVAQNSSGEWSPYVRFSLKLKLILTLAVSVLGFVASPYLATNLFHNPDLLLLLRLSFISLLGVVSYDFYTALTQALGKFLSSIWVQTAASIFKVGVLLVIIFLGTSETLPSYLVYLLSPLIGAVVGFLMVPKNYLVEKNVTAEHKKRVIDFSYWVGIGVLISAFAGNLDIFMVGGKLPTSEVGIYSAASRLSSIISIFASSLGIVLGVRASSLTDRSHLFTYLKKTVLLSILLLLLTAFIWPFSSAIISITVGEAYVGSLPIFKILLLNAAILVILSALNSNFYSFNKPQYFALSALVNFGVFLTLNILLIPRLGALGAAYGNLLSTVATFITAIIYLFFVVKKNYSPIS